MNGRSQAGSFDPALLDVALSLARHFGARRQDADDVAQEALLKLITYQATIQDPIAWLYVVTRRLLQRHAMRASAQLSGSAAAIDPWPTQELLIDAQTLLDQLPARGRTALRLSLAGYTERESAARLGCSVKALEKALHQGRRRLRDLRLR